MDEQLIDPSVYLKDSLEKEIVLFESLEINDEVEEMTHILNASCEFMKGGKIAESSMLLEKDTSFKFYDACLKAFDEMKRRLVTVPIIITPDWKLSFELMCDASGRAVGAVLRQRKEKIFYSIHYASITLNPAQMNYTVTEKELLAVEFDLEIRDRKGTENQVADHLSRFENRGHITEGESLKETFHDKQLLAITSDETPWYMDYVNFIASGVTPPAFTDDHRRRFLHDVRFYMWDEPFLYKQCADQLVSKNRYNHEEERDAFAKYFGIDYVSQWVESIAFPTNDAKVV
uniref:Reverse transcriptase/retrotransposon-derived protein RNase H-like domain-containing protein n=1 Tax=Nicotiana tabacum TaxID=4097 RepID=A0A1S4B870_TOBAC